ncbi:hypothetical protein V6N11_027001 [Hibiscus sabdariffa]|uniref:Uncharacterized protein n=1 Tax=Hibiscus sabdariffa TaxID=183260 RepID=A0ABR2PFM1_9ROSI
MGGSCRSEQQSSGQVEGNFQLPKRSIQLLTSGICNKRTREIIANFGCGNQSVGDLLPKTSGSIFRVTLAPSCSNSMHANPLFDSHFSSCFSF